MTVTYVSSGDYEVEVRAKSITLNKEELIEMLRELINKGVELDYIEDLFLPLMFGG